MESASDKSKTEALSRKRNAGSFVPNRSLPDKSGLKESVSALLEGDESFYNYVNWLGYDKDPNLLVLSSKHHYYYDREELSEVTTLINLKRLNFVKHLDSFIHVMSKIMSPDTTLLGCFYDRASKKTTGIHERIFNRVIGFLDDKTEIQIDRKEVSKLFESYGFRIIDMTEIDGLTYFATRKKNLVS
ncbi:MAG: hypothetical protein U0X39_07120 [Bacteroidales bacterium]